MDLKKKYKKIKGQLRKAKESAVKEIEEKSNLIEQVKSQLAQINLQKETIERLSKNPLNVSVTDETQKNAFLEQIASLKSKNEELNNKVEKLTREKKSIETEISDLKLRLTKSKDDIDILYQNLQESCAGFLSFKNQLEEKIEREVVLEDTIQQLKIDAQNFEKKFAILNEECKNVKNENEINVKKAEELRNRMISSDDSAYIFLVFKETIFGREKLLVLSKAYFKKKIAGRYCHAFRKRQG